MSRGKRVGRQFCNRGFLCRIFELVFQKLLSMSLRAAILSSKGSAYSVSLFRELCRGECTWDCRYPARGEALVIMQLLIPFPENATKELEIPFSFRPDKFLNVVPALHVQRNPATTILSKSMVSSWRYQRDQLPAARGICKRTSVAIRRNQEVVIWEMTKFRNTR